MKIKKSIELVDAHLLLETAIKAAHLHNINASIAIVDEGGYSLTSARMDQAGLLTPDVAMKKARTAALMRGPSRLLAERVRQEPELLSLTDYLPMTGGLPIKIDNQIVGAIGVSGGTPDQDERIGQAAIDKFLAA